MVASMRGPHWRWVGALFVLGLIAGGMRSPNEPDPPLEVSLVPPAASVPPTPSATFADNASERPRVEAPVPIPAPVRPSRTWRSPIPAPARIEEPSPAPEIVRDAGEPEEPEDLLGRYSPDLCDLDDPSSSSSNNNNNNNKSIIDNYQMAWFRLINRMNCGRVFSFVAYDHEALLLAGHVYSVAYHTGQDFGPPLAPSRQNYQELRADVIASLDYSRNQTGSTYEFGVPIPPCVEVLSSKGSEPAPGAAADVENLVTILGYLVDLPPRQISYSTLFTRRSHRRSEVFFESVLRGHGRAYLISFLDGVGAGEGMWKERVVRLPSDAIARWDERRGKVLDRVSDFVSILGQRTGAEGPPVILVSAGALTGVLISQMHQSNPNATYVDVDGLFDTSHAFAAHSATHDQLEANATSASSGGCAFTRYERVGDCVKPVGSTEVSRLCYPKGSRGEPKAGRVGGFFPKDKRQGRLDAEAREARRRKSLARRRRRTKAARESAENAAEKGGVGNAAAA